MPTKRTKFKREERRAQPGTATTERAEGRGTTEHTEDTEKEKGKSQKAKGKRKKENMERRHSCLRKTVEKRRGMDSMADCRGDRPVALRQL
ncbi:MAG: hypothetical protein D6679_01130, partial [Candidatus Hydrogenedentota bacterium]